MFPCIGWKWNVTTCPFSAPISGIVRLALVVVSDQASFRAFFRLTRSSGVPVTVGGLLHAHFILGIARDFCADPFWPDHARNRGRQPAGQRPCLDRYLGNGRAAIRT